MAGPEERAHNSISGAYQAHLQNALISGTSIAMDPRTIANGTSTTAIDPRSLINSDNYLAPSSTVASSIECGVLYAHNGMPLADDWRGAYIDKVDRRFTGTVSSPRWVYTFTSKWSNDAVALHLDALEMSGKEADKVAETYREALNQRRVG